jgi:hypothetical protein
MIRFEAVETYGWGAAVRGMRNPKNSWSKSDSVFSIIDGHPHLGSNDKKLMATLREAGTDHRKFLRMIVVSLDITAPMYWWAEFDTYKVGTVRNSCSKMHKLLEKPFEMNDFSFDKLPVNLYEEVARPWIDMLNELRDSYMRCLEEGVKKEIWYAILQLLPESYNQRATVLLNYEVLANIYKSRRNHKLAEWHVFCDWIETLPYSWLITGKEDCSDE